MKRRIVIALLAAVFLMTVSSAKAQQAKKVPRIGFLEGASIAESQGLDPFRQGLRDLGYLDGQNVIVEIRAMEGKPDRIPDLVAELIRQQS